MAVLRDTATATARTETIEGRKVQVIDRVPPLPPSLDRLLSLMDRRPVAFPLGGASDACIVLREHRLVILAEAQNVRCTDGRVRDLRARICPDCGAVEVRDVTLDQMTGLGLPIGRGGPRRRDLILGWYTGKRRAAREYR